MAKKMEMVEKMRQTFQASLSAEQNEQMRTTMMVKMKEEMSKVDNTILEEQEKIFASNLTPEQTDVWATIMKLSEEMPNLDPDPDSAADLTFTPFRGEADA